jgi:hypothetical protein
MKESAKIISKEKNPILDPIWALVVCSTCGRTGIVPPYTMVMHTTKTHRAMCVVCRPNITWKEAREKVNIHEVYGVPILNPEKPDKNLTTEQKEKIRLENQKRWREDIKRIDALADVHITGYDNLLET